MRIRINHDGYACLRAKLKKFASRIHFVCRFPQAGCVDLKCDTMLVKCCDRRFIVATQVSRRTVTKLLWQIRVRNKIKQFGFDAFNVTTPIKIPDFFDGLTLETRYMLRIIYIPTGTDIVDAADEIVPLLLVRELFDPPLEAGKII